MQARRGLLVVVVALFALGEALSGLSVTLSPHAQVSPLFWSALLGSLALVLATRAAPRAERIAAAALLPAYFLSARVLSDLASALHPVVFDGASFVADASMGFVPSFALGRLAAPIAPALAAAHIALPFAASLVLALEMRRAPRPRVDAAAALVVAGLVAGLLVHVLPTLGPRHAYPSTFPLGIPVPRAASVSGEVSQNVHRSSLISVDALWALLLFWRVRALDVGRAARIARATAATFAAAVLVAEIATGEHYAVDIAASVAVAVAVRAALATGVPLHARARWVPIAAGAALFAGWAILLRAAPLLLGRAPGLGAALFACTLVAPLALERALTAAERAERVAPKRADAPAGDVPDAGTPASTPAARGALVAVLAMFFASGFAGLVYEVMFAKSLALVFGSTATASTTVLATYMGGMSLGSWLGGRWGARARRPLVLYAVCEGGVAIACAVAPLLFGALRAVYVTLAHGMDPARPELTVLRVALGAALLLPPTVLMGMTLPLLGKQLTANGSGLGKVVGALYGANTLGAAAGALATGYVLLQYLGVLRTTLLAVALNLGVVFAALVWAKRAGDLALAPDGAHGVACVPESRAAARGRTVGLAILGVGGAVTLALEGVYTHLLAVVAGNSAFAFAAMLSCFLVGLGLGSSLGRAWLRSQRSAPLGVGVAQALVALSVLGGVFAWNVIPGYFAEFETYPLAREFSAREVVRFLVCSLELVPPALFIGASFPLAMEWVGRGARGNHVEALGRAAAINTLGNIAGALLGGFVLLPRFGSLRALQSLGAASLALALLPVAFLGSRERKVLAIPLAAGALVLALQPATFDLARLASGANVYFRAQGWGPVIAHAESAGSGLTTVNVASLEDEAPVHTLLTNGKFQGNDNHEIQAQISFALLPLLHTESRARALVIGFGTGTSTRIVSDSGFVDIDVAELSRDVAALADRYFASVNHSVLERPNVHLHVTDGRNYLLVEPRTYDLVTIEISSIWFAGAASLYDTEFYDLVKKRLAPGGVLQQWVQIHHLAPADYVAILSSLRSVFRSVWFYEVGGQGILVACDSDCAPTRAAIARIDEEPRLAEALRELDTSGAGAGTLLRARVLTPEGTDQFLAAAGATEAALARFASTDDNLALEYSTPRGNVREYDETYQRNMAALRAFSPRSGPNGRAELEGTHLSATP